MKRFENIVSYDLPFPFSILPNNLIAGNCFLIESAVSASNNILLVYVFVYFWSDFKHFAYINATKWFVYFLDILALFFITFKFMIGLKLYFVNSER